VFEIGNTLREARRRRGLEISDCEQATKIRGKYLRALEEEQFEILPGATYTKAFLRGYADYLDLDSQLLLDEYSSRYEEPADPGPESTPANEQPPPARGIRPWRPPPRRGGGGRIRVFWLAIGGAAAVALLVWAGANRSGGGDPEAVPTTPTQAARTTPLPPARTEPARARPAPAEPRPLRLSVSGVDGEGSYVQLRQGGPEGPVLWDGTVANGASRSWPIRGTLWLRLGWTPSARVTVGGKAMSAEGGTANFLVTRRGLVPTA